MSALNSEGMMGQPSSSVLAMKMYEERMKLPHSLDSETSPGLIKSIANHQGQSMQGNSGSMCAALQQIQAQNPLTTDIDEEMVKLSPLFFQRSRRSGGEWKEKKEVANLRAI